MPTNSREHSIGLAMRLAALALLLAFGAAACGGTSDDSSPERTEDSDEEEPTHGGSLVVGVPFAWTSLDPLQFFQADTTFDIGYALYGSLFRYDVDGNVQPSLATEYTVSDDKMSLTLTLREGVTFQDGTPFDAEAVKFNLDRYANPTNACLCINEVEMIESTTVDATHKLTIALREPVPEVLVGNLALRPGFMASPTAVEQAGGDFGLEPVGAGPFKFESAVPGSSITLSRWDGYWDHPKPYLDEVTFQVIPESDSRFASFQSGVIHVADLLEPGQLEPAQAMPDATVTDLGALGVQYVVKNMSAPPFDNIEARTALTLATDPAEINEALYGGRYPLGIEAPWGPTSWAFQEDVPGYPSFDRERASEIVEELGGLSFSLLFLNTPTNLELAEALQGQWEAAGMTVELRPLDQNAASMAARNGDFQAGIGGPQAGSPDPDALAYRPFHSTSAVSAAKMADPEVDELLAEQRQGTDRAERLEALTALAARLAELDPVTYLWATPVWRVASNEVYGIEPLPNNSFHAGDVWIEE